MSDFEKFAEHVMRPNPTVGYRYRVTVSVQKIALKQNGMHYVQTHTKHTDLMLTANEDEANALFDNIVETRK